MVDVKVDSKVLNELINDPRMVLVDTYTECGRVWEVFEVTSDVSLVHGFGDMVNVTLRMSVSYEGNGDVYVRDVSNQLNSDVPDEDLDDVIEQLANFDKGTLDRLERGESLIY